MFGVAHIHHLVEMVKFQGVKLTSAVALVCFLYLTLQLSQAWFLITCILAASDRHQYDRAWDRWESACEILKHWDTLGVPKCMSTYS